MLFHKSLLALRHHKSMPPSVAAFSTSSPPFIRPSALDGSRPLVSNAEYFQVDLPPGLSVRSAVCGSAGLLSPARSQRAGALTPRSRSVSDERATADTSGQVHGGRLAGGGQKVAPQRVGQRCQRTPTEPQLQPVLQVLVESEIQAPIVTAGRFAKRERLQYLKLFRTTS